MLASTDTAGFSTRVMDAETSGDGSGAVRFREVVSVRNLRGRWQKRAAGVRSVKARGTMQSRAQRDPTSGVAAKIM